MARPSCSSGDSRSSAPIPLIGLYVAGATLVCLVLMLWDIISSFRRKTRYIPCKWFSLNSATLTLLAIASKLPVDLTTYMPSAGDQLSKLTGTTMVEIFSFQSLANNRELQRVSIPIFLHLLLKGVITFTVLLTFIVLEVPLVCARSIFGKIMSASHGYCCHASSTNSSSAAAVVLEKWKTELREVFSPTKHFPNWIMRRLVEDMNKWTDLSNRSPPEFLVKLLSRPRTHHPPQALSNKLQKIGKAKGCYYKLSCLSMVILVKIVALSVPFNLAEPILRALDEAFEIVYYIDKKVNVGNFQDGKKRRFAKLLLAHKNVHLSKKDPSTNNLGMSVNEALSSITNEFKAFPNGLAKREMKIIRDLLRGQEHASTEELYQVPGAATPEIVELSSNVSF
ncbi:hypothetical protein Syun_005827 [Stephania yunnanensis]|uniref:Uncharacterized protein n=1 Tax=Stephania yunnanensis TaxID=152371 RepID=A0AAP0KVH0_9MAGN